MTSDQMHYILDGKDVKDTVYAISFTQNSDIYPEKYTQIIIHWDIEMMELRHKDNRISFWDFSDMNGIIMNPPANDPHYNEMLTKLNE